MREGIFNFNVNSMKTEHTNKFLLPIMVAGLIGLNAFISGCRKEPIERDEMRGYEPGSLSVMLTDSPGDYLQVNVEILEVQVHLADTASPAGWYSLYTNDTIYNLLDLQNDLSVLLANGAILPSGKITQLRMVLGANNTVVLKDSSTHPMECPSGQKPGIKVNVNSLIMPGDTTRITLDFDAGKSVVNAGDQYILKPVIKVKNISFH